MKEAWNFIKDLWKNKRTRAIAILVLYSFFFIFVYFFISANKPVSIPPTPLKGLEALEQVKHYYLEIQMDEVVEVSCENDCLITYQNEPYTMDTIPINLEKYNLSFWTPVNLKNIIEKATLVSTNYLEKKDTYQTTNQDILPWENNYDIIIEAYKKEDQIIKVTMEQKEIPFYLVWEVKE